MESGLSNKQRTIQIPSNVLQIMQFPKNISMDDEQHIPRIAP